MHTLKQKLKGVKVKAKRIPRKIYFRGSVKSQPKVVIVVKRCAVNGRCKVCYKVRPRDEMTEIGGGGTQGHRSYLICPGCA